jgi:hypothetical protein
MVNVKNWKSKRAAWRRRLSSKPLKMVPFFYENTVLPLPVMDMSISIEICDLPSSYKVLRHLKHKMSGSIQLGIYCLFKKAFRRRACTVNVRVL